MKKGFTLIELLLVVAIVAVIGAGVAVRYGRETVDDAKKQMTLHEMAQIRDAFRRFWSDNASQMMDGMTLAGSSTPLPSSSFAFTASDTQTFDPSLPADNPQRLYGAMEFFERYGLWPLFEKSVGDANAGARETQIFDASAESRKYSFRQPSPVTGDGWRGPYLSASERVECVSQSTGDAVPEAVYDGKTMSGAAVSAGDVRFPQPKTKFDGGNGGFYRVVYFEHCEDESEGRPVYRRLLLVAAQNPAAFDEPNELARFRGNRRYSGTDAAPPVDPATGAVKTFDDTLGVFFMELLDFDTTYR